jgi:hypothetical protein
MDMVQLHGLSLATVVTTGALLLLHRRCRPSADHQMWPRFGKHVCCLPAAAAAMSPCPLCLLSPMARPDRVVSACVDNYTPMQAKLVTAAVGRNSVFCSPPAAESSGSARRWRSLPVPVAAAQLVLGSVVVQHADFRLSGNSQLL